MGRAGWRGVVSQGEGCEVHYGSLEDSAVLASYFLVASRVNSRLPVLP